VPQVRRDLLEVGFLSDRDYLRGSVDLCCIRKYWSLEPPFDDAVVLHIEKREGGDKQKREDCKGREREAKYWVTEAAVALLAVLSVRDSNFNRHVWIGLVSGALRPSDEFMSLLVR